MRQALERAGGAFWSGLAEFFAEADEQGVVFVEEPHILREIRLEQVLQLLVGGIRLDQVVAGCDAGSVGIDYEDGSIECVEQDRVCGFRAYSFDG